LIIFNTLCVLVT